MVCPVLVAPSEQKIDLLIRLHRTECFRSETAKPLAIHSSGSIILHPKARERVFTGGIEDMHAHYEQVEWGPIYLAAGVTSVRDVGNEFDFIRTLRDELERNQNPAVGPHLEFAGLIDGTGPLTLGATIADTPQQARQWVERYKAAGARSRMKSLAAIRRHDSLH